VQSLRKRVVRETKTAYPVLVPRSRVEQAVLAQPVLELTETVWKALPVSQVLKDARQQSMEAPAGMVSVSLVYRTTFNVLIYLI
jgi:hypothetical protein